MNSDLAHRIATWVGLLGLTVAIALPVANVLRDADTDPVVMGIVAALSVVFLGSKRASDLLAKLIRAWRGN